MSVTREGTRRRGFSLAELIVSMALFCVVGVATVTALVTHRRHAAAIDESLELRTRLREAAAILAADLRSASASGGDLVRVTDSAIVFRTTTGVGVVCEIRNGGRSLALMPPGPRASGSAMTSWIAEPTAGQPALIYDDSSGQWSAHALVAGVSRLATRCPAPLGRDTDLAAVMIHIAPAFARARVGAPVRFLRFARYALYRSADREWYLGTASAESEGRLPPIQPVSGPFLPYRAAGASGMSIACYDSASARIPAGSCASAPDVMAVGIVLRARTAPIPVARDLPRPVHDSARILVSLPDD